MADTTVLAGTTADGVYVASASSNVTLAWQAFSRNESQTWTSANEYAIDGTYDGAASTGALRGEWVQLDFPEPFVPQSISIASNAASGKLLGSYGASG